MSSTQTATRFRAGPVACVAWEDAMSEDTRSVVLVRTKAERRWKDRHGRWQPGRLSRSDIPLAVWSLQKALEELFERAREEEGERE